MLDFWLRRGAARNDTDMSLATMMCVAMMMPLESEDLKLEDDALMMMVIMMFTLLKGKLSLLCSLVAAPL